MNEAKRYDKAKKSSITISRPTSVNLYNNLMGDVNKVDMYLSLYRSKLGNCKWYHRIAYHSLTVVNALVI